MEAVRLSGIDSLLETTRDFLQRGYLVLAWFGSPEELIYCLLGKSAKLELFCCPFPPDRRYPSLTPHYPAFQVFERELYEQYGITPIRHPWLKGFRFPPENPARMTDYPFLKSESELIHEVGVGPVHAGVIEPGHFRFLLRGEIIEHLEIQLGYQHRSLMQLMSRGALAEKIHFAESIAGDTVIANATAFCRIVEDLSETKAMAREIRLLLLEMERVAMHLSTLSALAGDLAYIMGQNLFAALRTSVINSTLSICGSRFGKRALCVGGVNYPLNPQLIADLKRKMKDCAKQIHNSAEAMFANSSVLSRLDDTGKVATDIALRFGFSGICAKASGIPMDLRADFPDELFEGYLVQTEISGDVYARAFLRYTEAMQSLDMIQILLNSIDPDAPICASPKPLQANRIAIALVESARGRLLHIAKTANDASTAWYRVIDPSMQNWQALAIAVKGEQISDFPLCNKSFDLSYCGSDL